MWQLFFCSVCCKKVWEMTINSMKCLILKIDRQTFNLVWSITKKCTLYSRVAQNRKGHFRLQNSNFFFYFKNQIDYIVLQNSTLSAGELRMDEEAINSHDVKHNTKQNHNKSRYLFVYLQRESIIVEQELELYFVARTWYWTSTTHGLWTKNNKFMAMTLSQTQKATKWIIDEICN